MTPTDNNGIPTNQPVFRFDEFEVDSGNRLLRRNGDTIPLTAKVFDVLVVFVQNPDRLLEKEELIQNVWPDDFVEEGNLARNVSTLRKALGEAGKDRKYIATVQGRGYRFVADVKQIAGNGKRSEMSNVPVGQKPSERRGWNRKFLLLAVMAAVFVVAAVWVGSGSLYSTRSARIKSIAILPLKPADPLGNELGIGITDSIIRRLSSTGEVIVRPTSAVRPYLTKDTDALAAGRELGTDAVLEGTVLRDNERLRISVNLLTTQDGASIWTDSFDLSITDIFAIQDTVSRQIALRLRLQLDRDKMARLEKRMTSDPIAYEYYLKAQYSFDQRRLYSQPSTQINAAIDFYRKAIEADPNFALAYAQLGYAYCWRAISTDPDPKWAELSREMLDRAQSVDPQIAEIHVARSLLLSSSYENWDFDGAIRELRAAQQLDPSVGHVELSALYFFTGLEEQGELEVGRALEVDPTSDNVKRQFLINYWNSNRYDDWYTAARRYFPNEPLWPWYLVGKGRLTEAEKDLDKLIKEDPDPLLRSNRAILYAIKGNARAAESEIPLIVRETPRQNGTYKNAAYNIACIYAINGKSRDAVKWLNEAAKTGIASFPLFSRDPNLDRIRNSPEFIDFMTAIKARYDRYIQQFS